MKITKLKIRLISNKNSLIDLDQQHLLLLPVDLELIPNPEESDLFEIDQLFTLVITSELFSKYGLVQLDNYGVISRRKPELFGITGTLESIEVKWLIRGFAKKDGAARIKFGFRGFDYLGLSDPLTLPYDIKVIREGISVVDFEIRSELNHVN